MCKFQKVWKNVLLGGLFEFEKIVQVFPPQIIHPLPAPDSGGPNNEPWAVGGGLYFSGPSPAMGSDGQGAQLFADHFSP